LKALFKGLLKGSYLFLKAFLMKGSYSFESLFERFLAFLKGGFKRFLSFVKASLRVSYPF